MEDLGYKLTQEKHFFRTCALYRNGKNPMSLRIDSRNGSAYDFGSGEYFKDIYDLVARIKGIKPSEAKKNFFVNGHSKIRRPEFDIPNIYDPRCLISLEKNYDFFLEKGISKTTLQLFKAGLAKEKQMKDRVVFPVFNSEEDIVGFAGRLTYESKYKPKWKIIGKKKYFAHPLPLSRKEILSSECLVIVESIGDQLVLWENGVKNVLVSFGVSLGEALFRSIIATNPKKILLSFNADKGGDIAIINYKKKLKPFFDKKSIIEARLPSGDFGEADKQTIEDWKGKFLYDK